MCSLLQKLKSTSFTLTYAAPAARLCNLRPYSAITFDEEKEVSEVNEALCKGYGVRVAACPSSAITGKRFTTEQIMAQIEEVLV